MKSKNIKIASLLLFPILVSFTASCGNNGKKSVEEYAIRAMNQAKAAADSGTFGVGGILMDLKGKVICEMHNRVIEGRRVNDPTAHGERQIVEWYLENKEKDNLPNPEDLVLFTTLDPCVMCTGALSQVQFNRVIVIALDDYAGINWEGNAECHALDNVECQQYVKEHFAYPEVTGEHKREAFGASLSDLKLFSNITVSSETLIGCQEAFSLTADDVRNKVSSTSVDLKDIKNPAELENTHPMYAYLSNSFGNDFLGCTWKEGESSESITNYLQENHPNFNGVAYFDMFGNLLTLAEDDVNICTKSAFMKVTRKYASVRNTEPIQGYEINEYLSNPKYGYFVYITCPELITKTVMEIGAIGSTLENTSVHPIMYINGEENSGAITSFIAKLPPLYNSNINIQFAKIS